MPIASESEATQDQLDLGAFRSVAAVANAIQSHQDDLDSEADELVARQAQSNVQSVERMQAARTELADLFQRIEHVRTRAEQTERAITEMTADIKRLDATKRNLTLSMTALKRLQMLTTAYEQLLTLGKAREYRECAQLVQAVIQLMAHFKSYRSIDQIATLSRNVADLQRELQEQICEDFELAFAKGQVRERRATLAEGCLVVDAMGENARSRLIVWYCNTQLREYRQLFRSSEEAGSLDNISRRYSWFKRILKTYDDDHSAIFPSAWKVNEVLANNFCEGTKDDFKGILSRSVRRADGQTLDVDLLLSCLQQTLDFEQFLEHKLAAGSRTSSDTVSSKDEKHVATSRAISEAFEPYLSLWVHAQDRQLSVLITKYRRQPLKPPDEDFTPQSVAMSSIELFQTYRAMLAQCAKLSTGHRLLELSLVFAKYLDQYAEQALLSRFSGQTPGKEPPLEDIIIMLNTADYCHATSGQLEEKIKGRIDPEWKGRVDLRSQQDAFMGVASAAVRTLVRKVEHVAEPAWREMRNIPWGKLDSVGDQSHFIGDLLERVRSTAARILQLLVKQQYARAFCDNLVELLANTYLANILLCRPISETGAEQMLLDLYVLKKGSEELLTLNAEPGTTPPQSYVRRVNQSMQKLDPLLKTLQVRTVPPEGLVQAYLIHIGDRSDSNFKKILDLKGVRRQEQAQLIELFQAHRASPRHSTTLVQQSPLLTPLNIPSSSLASAASSSSSAAASSLASLGTAAALSTPSLQARFDPATLGLAIMSVARDGVDLFGAPSSSSVSAAATSSTTTTTGAAASSSASSSAPPGAPSTLLPASSSSPSGGAGHDSAAAAAATAGGANGVALLPSSSASASGSPNLSSNNLQENLRNIGRFFKRDLGAGFSGRFGAGGGGGGGSGGSRSSRQNSEDAT